MAVALLSSLEISQMMISPPQPHNNWPLDQSGRLFINLEFGKFYICVRYAESTEKIAIQDSDLKHVLLQLKKYDADENVANTIKIERVGVIIEFSKTSIIIRKSIMSNASFSTNRNIVVNAIESSFISRRLLYGH